MNNSVSVVIPVYNSSAILPELIRRLYTVLPAHFSHFEVILVNDGSVDASWGVVSEICKEYQWVKGINMMRNYGQHNALLCGVRAAFYDIIVTMDDDLQHPPEEIPKLLAKLAEGYDVVYGAPIESYQNWWRKFIAIGIRKVLSFVMGVGTFRNISPFRALKTNLRCSFENYNNPDVLLDVLLSWGTPNFASVHVKLEPRKIGKSNYTFLKLFNTGMLVLTAFSTAPLRIASLIGFAFMFLGVLVFVYVLALYFLVGSMPGFPFLASIISLFSGAQLFALGILGEYLARMFLRSMHRPPYVVKETTSFLLP